MKRVLTQQVVDRDRSEKIKRALLKLLRPLKSLRRFVWVPCLLLVIALSGAALKASPVFSVRSIEVSGNLKYLSVPEVVTASGVAMGENLLRLPLLEVEKKVAALKWVRDVSVRREMPSRLWIHVTEEEPRGLLLSDKLYYLSREGVAFKEVETERYRNLPVITGTSRREEIVEALQILQQIEAEREMDLFGLSEIRFDPVLGYSLITLSGPMEILLGRTEIGKKIARLKDVWTSYGQKLGKVRGIDLNYEDRAFVKL